MSAIVAYGHNVFEVAETYDTYVKYRIADSTLNPWNYEPVYAVRHVEPTELAPLPSGAFVHSFSVNLNLTPHTPGHPPILTNEAILDVNDPVVHSVNEVPEPSYTVVLLVLFIAVYIRTKAQSSWRQHFKC